MKTVVVIPTYNESGNILPLISEIKKLKLEDLEILVVDDDSPDLTWKLVEELGSEDPTIHCLRRTKNRGRGYSGIEGFKRALDMGADYVIEMDGDLSHDPKHIPKLLEVAKEFDVSIGSRFEGRGTDIDRNRGRRILTLGSNWIARLVLGLDIKDCNSGYRCFNRSVLEKLLEQGLHARHADIVQEVIYHIKTNGFSMKEVEIDFKDRKTGKTTKTPADFARGLKSCLKLRVLGHV